MGARIISRSKRWRIAKSPFGKSLTMEIFDCAWIIFKLSSEKLRLLLSVVSIYVLQFSELQTLRPCPSRTLGSLDEKILFRCNLIGSRNVST